MMDFDEREHRIEMAVSTTLEWAEFIKDAQDVKWYVAERDLLEYEYDEVYNRVMEHFNFKHEN